MEIRFKIIGGKFANGAVSAAFTNLFNHAASFAAKGKPHSHTKPVIKPGLYRFVAKGSSATILLAAVEGGDMYVFDDLNKQTLHYGYMAAGPGAGVGLSVFGEKGEIYLNTVSDAEGWTAAWEGDLTVGVGANSTAQGNPFNGLNGASTSMGVSAGFNFGGGFLGVNTYFIETIPYSSVDPREFSY